MTLPPHGPPEITEAQQAATSLGEVEDPTPDNVSRALQDYSPYAVASAAAALGASGGGGGGGGGIPQGGPLTEDLNTGGFAFADDAGGAVTVSDGEVSVTSAGGDVNVTTDPDNGGDITVNAGSQARLISNFGNTTINANAGPVNVTANTNVTLSGGSGAGVFRMQTDGSAWWLLSEPADAAIDAGTFAFWLDPTDGAAKFKIKAKTLDGSVVTGQIALA